MSAFTPTTARALEFKASQTIKELNLIMLPNAENNCLIYKFIQHHKLHHKAATFICKFALSKRQDLFQWESPILIGPQH